MRAFEIHTFQGGKWKIDSVFDDRDLAVFEAQRMEGSKRYPGVRVIEETFDERTQKTATRTIYKGTVVDNIASAEQAKRQTTSGKDGRALPRGAAGARRPGKAPALAKTPRSNGLLIAIFSIIVIVGIGAIVALRLLSGKM